MEQVTGAPAEGKDSEDEQNAPDSSSPTGKTADQDQQILVDTGDTNWFKSTQALKHLQPVFVPIVKDKMKNLQLQSMTDFGRQLCAEATSDDIIRANDNLAQFKHLCPGTVIACQNLLNIIKGHTTDSVRFYQMLIGTDPQNWLKSPFEFARLFLKDWMRRDIHDFQECDITALCTIVKRCKPLMQIFDERKVDELRKVRNRTMHPATMSITQQEMEENINVILEFLEHIKALKATDEATKASECIKQLRTGDVSLLHTVVDRLIRGWIHDAKIEYELKLDAKNNQHQDINYMENKLARMSSAQEATAPTKQSEEQKLEAKCTVTEGRDSDEDLYLHPVPNRAGENADQDHQCMVTEGSDSDEDLYLHPVPNRAGEDADQDHQCTVTEGRDSDEDLYLYSVPRRAGANADQDHQDTVAQGEDLNEQACNINVPSTTEKNAAYEYQVQYQADDNGAMTFRRETLGLPTLGPADDFDENTYSLETLGLPTPCQADDFDENTYSLETLGLPTPCQADDFNENTYSLETLGLPTPSLTLIQRMCLCCKKCTITEGRDSDEDLYLIPVPNRAGENADQDHQADDVDDITYGMKILGEPIHFTFTVSQGSDSDMDLYCSSFESMTAVMNADEDIQSTVAHMDPYEELFCPILPPTAGENADEVQKADDFDETTHGMNTLHEPTYSMADDFDELTYGMKTPAVPTYCPADDFYETTYGLEVLGLPTPSPYTVAQGEDSDEQACYINVPSTSGENADEVHQADDVGEITYGMKIRPEKAGCSYTKGEDSDEKASYIDVPSTTGENADQAHQILTDESDTNWFKTTQSLKYLLPVLLSFIEDKIIRLHEETLTDFGRQLCTEATSDDIIRARGNVAQFKHLCPGTVVTCQNLLTIIKGHTRDSVDFYQMLKGTDPQNWLKSPFEFARLFLKDWMRSDIHDFQECDILALCTIIKRCKPLMQIFDERKLDELRNVRNRTMHPHTMGICQHEMEDHINAILDFLQHMKTLKNTDEVIKAMESITQSRADDVRSRQSIFVRLIQGWLPGARMEYKHKLDEANNQLKDINYMENKLVKGSAAQEATAHKDLREEVF